MYGLRKIFKDGIHWKYTWPLEVGAIATAPDWNPKSECGGGLHMLPNGIGNYDLLEGDLWAVVEFDEAEMIVIDGNKAKVPSCKIVYLSEDPPKYTDWFNGVPRSETAYRWAMSVGDKEYMKQFVTDSENAYYWAEDIGDRKHMKQFVTDSYWAYKWAVDIGDRKQIGRAHV